MTPEFTRLLVASGFSRKSNGAIFRLKAEATRLVQQEADREDNERRRKVGPRQQEADREDNERRRKVAPWQQEADREDKR
ncbi:MAG: hypothetical protein ACRD1U_08805 [Vicinamibacterales bacterium]